MVRVACPLISAMDDEGATAEIGGHCSAQAQEKPEWLLANAGRLIALLRQRGKLSADDTSTEDDVAEMLLNVLKWLTSAQSSGEVERHTMSDLATTAAILIVVGAATPAPGTPITQAAKTSGDDEPTPSEKEGRNASTSRVVADWMIPNFSDQGLRAAKYTPDERQVALKRFTRIMQRMWKKLGSLVRKGEADLLMVGLWTYLVGLRGLLRFASRAHRNVLHQPPGAHSPLEGIGDTSGREGCREGEAGGKVQSADV